MGEEEKEAAGQRSEITIVKTKSKQSETSSHGRNENTITIYTAYERMFLELIAIDDSTSVFQSLAVTLYDTQYSPLFTKLLSLQLSTLTNIAS